MKNELPKRASESKTVNFGLLIIMLGLVEQNSELFREFLKDHHSFFMFAVGLTICILRYYTTAPLLARAENILRSRK